MRTKTTACARNISLNPLSKDARDAFFIDVLKHNLEKANILLPRFYHSWFTALYRVAQKSKPLPTDQKIVLKHVNEIRFIRQMKV